MESVPSKPLLLGCIQAHPVAPGAPGRGGVGVPAADAHPPRPRRHRRLLHTLHELLNLQRGQGMVQGDPRGGVAPDTLTPAALGGAGVTARGDNSSPQKGKQQSEERPWLSIFLGI